MPTVYIYVLADPRTLEIKYVGSTIYIRKRKAEHWHNPQGTELKQWVHELHEVGLQPIFSILKKTTIEERYNEEGYWISYFSKKGHIFNTQVPMTRGMFNGWRQVDRLLAASDVTKLKDREMLTIRQAAERMHMKPETFRRFWIIPKKLPAFMVGNQWRIWADEVDKVLEQNFHPDSFNDLNLPI